MKLIINSHIKYSVPLSIALQSLYDFNFQYFNDVIIVIGGCNEDKEPQKINYEINGQIIEIIEIRCKLNNYDFTGLSQLNKYKNHELIRSDSYFYTLDTVHFGQTFNSVYTTFSEQFKNPDNCNNIITHQLPNSSIMIFGKCVIDNYKTNFDYEMTKQDAVLMECGDPNPAIPVKHISSFGTTKYYKPRYFIGNENIYKTGHGRAKFYYLEFDLYKYVFLHHYGDIQNNIKKIF